MHFEGAPDHFARQLIKLHVRVLRDLRDDYLSLMHAPRIASTTSSSCRGTMVRRSSSNRSSAMQPISGGFDARRLAAKSASDAFSGTMSIVTDGMLNFGKVPPPALALPRPIAIVSGKPCNRAQIAAPRTRNSSSEIRRSARAGILAVALLR